MRTFRPCLLLALSLGCSRSPAGDSTSKPASVASPGVESSAPVPNAATTSPAPTQAATPTAAADTSVSTEPPASFDKGQSEAIGNAVGLGCEPRSASGWLEILCRKKNGTGGHPVRAVVNTEPGAGSDSAAPLANDAGGDAGDGREVLADDRKELRVVLPFQDGKKSSATFEWTDTRYELALDGTHGSFTWAGIALPHRRECQALLDENQKRIAEAQKGDAPTRVLPAEAHHLPKFGVCQPAGLGSFALSLARFSGKGEGTARSLVFEVAVVHVDLDGHRLSAPFGTLEVAPGGFEVEPLRVYDYDDDGSDELIVPYDIKALPAGAAPPALAALWSLHGSSLAPYAHAPAMAGGVAIEQLDSDMRPDLATYGPFVGWLGADCGAKTCPTRINGTKLYFHSLADGTFSASDDAARAADKRGCKAAKTLVAETGGGVNLAKTAENLACARVLGTPLSELKSELAAKHEALCGSAAACAVASAFDAWLAAPLPSESVTARAE